ncbi:flagellar biosynthesis anti-sigma factor FlgM [Paenibacillus sp. VCA1]|uniref:flagellar biosynthesis anti-sigma factor FlgM n=1 Tax=Paenibacillus sp. VCA1 TaxID=3039148 RepID=UPI0028722683|nr:flagellar biosynthesis anti-sigma factor FlgM [Paenibacillus sp. VCA1]MDR9853374.1 flagellar biosynthesis anti-sigma factor FlgM [Paenibacillus sp. VCA1]
MKVNDTGRLGGINPYQRNVESREYHVEKKKRQTDKVSFSPEALEMLDDAKRAQDPERAKRIQQLKESVATGTYHVEAGKLAEKLLPYFKSYSKSGDKE